MAIAGPVLEGVLKHAGGRRVTRVQLKVGHLRQDKPVKCPLMFRTCDFVLVNKIDGRGREAA